MRAPTRTEQWRRRTATLLDGLSRYDLLLTVIPLAFLVAAVVGQVFAAHARTLIAGAALVGALAVADALFVNPPQSGTGRP